MKVQIERLKVEGTTSDRFLLVEETKTYLTMDELKFKLSFIENSISTTLEDIKRANQYLESLENTKLEIENILNEVESGEK